MVRKGKRWLRTVRREEVARNGEEGEEVAPSKFLYRNLGTV
jgi:hypothetical protein